MYLAVDAQTCATCGPPTWISFIGIFSAFLGVWIYTQAEWRRYVSRPLITWRIRDIERDPNRSNRYTFSLINGGDLAPYKVTIAGWGLRVVGALDFLNPEQDEPLEVTVDIKPEFRRSTVYIVVISVCHGPRRYHIAWMPLQPDTELTKKWEEQWKMPLRARFGKWLRGRYYPAPNGVAEISGRLTKRSFNCSQARMHRAIGYEPSTSGANKGGQ